MISNFRGKHFFLSNFYGHPVEYEGITYETVTRETSTIISQNMVDTLGLLW